MLAVGRRTREGRCQPVESKVAKPVRASGTGTPQKEAWPEAVGTCQAAQSCLCGVAPGGGGERLPPRTPPCREPCRPHNRDPTAPYSPVRPPPSATNTTTGSKPGGTLAPGNRDCQARDPGPSSFSAPQAQARLQPPQHQATDPPTLLRPSVVRSRHTGGGRKRS